MVHWNSKVKKLCFLKRDLKTLTVSLKKLNYPKKSRSSLLVTKFVINIFTINFLKKLLKQKFLWQMSSEKNTTNLLHF